ncbi:MAG: hypothetical protein J7L15_08610, partial [Clostridiales bacterium]|nr:hypothetical protein [Clostridiales bacterium]
TSYHIIESDFKIDTLSKNKFIQLPILIFYNNSDEYIFINTNILLNIDFDQLNSNGKQNYLVAINNNYKFDNLSKIIENRVSL